MVPSYVHAENLPECLAPEGGNAWKDSSQETVLGWGSGGVVVGPAVGLDPCLLRVL